MSRRHALLRLSLRGLTALFFLFAAIVLGSRYYTAAQWPTVLGTVERVDIVLSGDPDDSRTPGEQFRIEISYRYNPDSEERISTRLTLYPWIFRNPQRAQAFLDRNGISSGGRVPVFYDPDDPKTAVVVRNVPWGRGEVLGVLLLLVILPLSVVIFSVVDLIRGGASRRDDTSRGRLW